MEQYFHIERTEHPEKLKAVYYLRYQVFCEERGFIPKQMCPDQLEMDEYDKMSLHFAAYYIKDQKVTGTVRLVKGDDLEQMPLGKKCRIDRGLLPIGFKQTKCAEISRLAVSKRMRRRATDGHYPQEKEDDSPTHDKSDKRAKFPEIIMGLYKALYQETKLHGIEHWLAAMEPSLVKLLRRLNIQFQEIGPEADYYGVVRPYIASVSDFEWALYTRSPELYSKFSDGLEQGYIPSFVR
jgi:N-acyl amino acid synthase of PEP-CTERM/exosortase system